jgi:CRP/FNR family cyclic AMP-dependent transcriptional regulator
MAPGADDNTIEVVSFPKGKVLFKQGEKGDAAFIVQSGAIGMYREAQGRKIPLATVRKGELFGEMAVIDPSPRLATAFALEESSVMVVPIGVMLDKLRKADPFIRAMISMLMNNLRGVHESYMPKSRSMADAVNMLARQADIVTRFLAADMPANVRTDLTTRLKGLEAVIKDLKKVAAVHREEDRRDEAIPAESELPQ